MSAPARRGAGSEQWLHCRACNRRFTVAITIPCLVDVWLAAMRGARCACGAGPDALFAYEPGRRPPELTPPTTPPELDPV